MKHIMYNKQGINCGPIFVAFMKKIRHQAVSINASYV